MYSDQLKKSIKKGLAGLVFWVVALITLNGTAIQFFSDSRADQTGSRQPASVEDTEECGDPTSKPTQTQSTTSSKNGLVTEPCSIR